MAEAVALLNITKTFPGVMANKDVSLSVQEGEIRAIVGENGAGKTTLMRILYGLERPDTGIIRVKGKEVKLPNARAAIAAGVGMVHQHFKLVSSYTLAQNVVLGVEPRRGFLVNQKECKQIVDELSARYGLAVNGERLTCDASVGEQQRAEILKALYRGADILILDEPTAVLTDGETEELFVMLRSLAADGKTILFISHKLREVLAVSDQTTVMRRGEIVGTVRTSDTDRRELAEMMVGRDTVGGRLRQDDVPIGEPVLELQKLYVEDAQCMASVLDVDLALRQGEVLGIAGVDGNGQVELVEAITGLRHVTSGRILLDGKEIQNQKPRAIREAGVAHIPSDRNATGIAQQAQVWENLAAVEYYAPPYSGRMALSLSRIMSDAKDLILRFGVQTPGLKSATGNLSGGNIQRLIVARELGSEKAQVVVASQPTRGIDIAGTEAIREMLLDYTRRDAGVLLISADLDEILALSDRVMVMYEGCLTDAGKVDDGIRQRIGQLMTGGSIDD